MRDPRRFVGFLSDELDPDSFEVVVLHNAMGVGYLERFADAAEKGTTASVRDAAMRATAQLEHELAIRGDVASCVSLSIGLGVVDFLGLDASAFLPSANRDSVPVTNTPQQFNAPPVVIPPRDTSPRTMPSSGVSRQQNDMQPRDYRADAMGPRLDVIPHAPQSDVRAQPASGSSASVPDASNKGTKNRSRKIVLQIVAILAAIGVARLVAVQFIVPSFLDSVDESSTQASSALTEEAPTKSSDSIGSKTKDDADDNDTDEGGSADKATADAAPAQVEDSSAADVPASTESEEESSLDPPFNELDALWWGGRTDTEYLVCYVENPDTQRAGFMAMADGRISWWTGSLTVDGSTVTIGDTNSTDEDAPYTLYITSRTEDAITIQTDDYGSGTLPILNNEQRQIISNALDEINRA